MSLSYHISGLLCKTWKKFFYKVHILHLKALAVQLFQRARVGSKVEGKFIGIQRLSVAAIPPILPLTAIFAISQEGVTSRGELGSDLVRSPSNQVTFYQGQSVSLRQCLVICNSCFGPRFWLFPDVNLLFYLIFKDIALQPSIWRRHMAMNYAQIELRHLPIADLLVHHPQPLSSLSRDNNPSSIPVDTIA